MKVKELNHQAFELAKRNEDLENLITEYEIILEKRDSELEDLKIVLQEKDEIIQRRSTQGSFHKQNSQSFHNEDSLKKTITELNEIITNLEESVEISNHQLAAMEKTRVKDLKMINQLNIELQQIQDELEQYRQYYKDNTKTDAYLKKKVEKPKQDTQIRPKSKPSDVTRDSRKETKVKSMPFSSSKISSSITQTRFTSKTDVRSQADLSKNPRD